MPSIPQNSAGRLRVYVYSSDVPPALQDPVSINMSLYDPQSRLIYFGNTPIRVSQGIYEFSLPAYLFLNKASYTTPYNATSIITFTDGTIESQGQEITVK